MTELRSGQDTVVITDDMVKHASTPRGAYTKAQLEVFGVPWPPVRGWKKNLIGREVSRESWDRFLSLKDDKRGKD